MKNKKNILITGGAGFIGSNLLQLFLINKKFKKYKFVIVDNSENFSNVQFSLKNERVVLVKCDFTDSYLLSDIENNVYEHIIHFAAISSVPISIKKPLKSNQENLTKTLKLINSAKKSNKLKSFIFASSAAIYNPTLNANQKYDKVEKYNPNTPYSIQKYSIEKYGLYYKENYNLNFKAFRFFNVYGPNQSQNNLIGNWLTEIWKNKNYNLNIFGNGNQLRDYVYVNDVCNSVIENTNNKKQLEIEDVGTSYCFSTKQISEIFKKIFKNKYNIDLKFKHVNPRKGENGNEPYGYKSHNKTSLTFEEIQKQFENNLFSTSESYRIKHEK